MTALFSLQIVLPKIDHEYVAVGMASIMGVDYLGVWHQDIYRHNVDHPWFLLLLFLHQWINMTSSSQTFQLQHQKG